MECNNQKTQLAYDCRKQIIKIMHEGGYFDSIINAGNEFDRVKEFLLAIKENKQHLDCINDKSLPRPRLLPLFPKINNQFLHNSEDLNYLKLLEENYQVIRKEALSLDKNYDFFNYSIRDMPKNKWHIHLFSYMGYNIKENGQLCPQTMNLLNLLPNRCQIYPWGDAVLSVLEPGSHIPAHYSVDNLRVRCMLGLVVLEGCEMRVGTIMTTWQEGKILLFEDSFEHEVWHRGNSDRIVLILDFWHPELRPYEIEILTIGLSHPKICRIIYEFLSNDSEQYSEYLSRSIKDKKLPPNFYKYWDRNKLYN